MPNLVNQMVVDEYRRTLEDAEGLVLVSLGGLSVAEVDGLRGELAERGAGLRMMRNSLARRVFQERGHKVGDELFAGNVAMAWGSTEATILAAKVLTSPQVKKAGKVNVRAGLLEGELLGSDDARALADVPDHDTLRAMLVGCIQGPARALASLLQALPGGMARVLGAHADSEGDADPAS